MIARSFFKMTEELFDGSKEHVASAKSQIATRPVEPPEPPDPDAATAALGETRLAWAEFQADIEIDADLSQQFEVASDAVREAIAERQQERVAEQARADQIAREQADRVSICQQIEQLSGPDAVDRIAELKVQWDALAPMPSEYAASLNRRFQDACRAFEDHERRRLLAQAAAGRLETLATELEQLVASDQALEEIVARWRGLRRDADVLREHSPANPLAAERLERAVATLEEKEHQQQQVRAKQEQDNLKRLQQVCRQVETLAAAEQITLKAGDRALRDIRTAIDESVPLPSSSRRVATVIRRRSLGSDSTASMALRTRFSATCSMSRRSARTAGGVAESRRSKLMPASRAAGSARCSTAPTSSFRSCSVNAGPGGRSRSLSRWMILPARLAWSRQMCMACCSSPVSGLPDCSMRMQLWL